MPREKQEPMVVKEQVSPEPNWTPIACETLDRLHSYTNNIDETLRDHQADIRELHSYTNNIDETLRDHQADILLVRCCLFSVTYSKLGVTYVTSFRQS